MSREGPLHEPPKGLPWDASIKEAPLVFVDLEMTGLRPEKDRVIEVCAERVRGERVEASIESLVRPECGAMGNAHIHGIAAAEIAAAPTFSEIEARLYDVLDQGIVVAHSAAWDVAFLEAEYERVGRPVVLPFFLDTLTLSRRAFALPSHSLAALCSELGITRVRQHRAKDDVQALREVFRRVVDVLAPETPRDLWHVRIGERHARPSVIAAALRACEQDETVRIRYRPAHRAPEELMMRVTSVRTDLDPPRVLGYLLPSRSRRELRADRILAIDSVVSSADAGRR